MKVTMITKPTGIVLFISILIYYICMVKYFIKLQETTTSDKLPKELHIFREYQLHFLTCWNFAIQICFLIIAVIDDSFSLLQIRGSLLELLNKFRNYLFIVLLLPTTLVVISIFWTVFLYDREMILPKAIDAIFPYWMNHTMHTVICLPIFIEIYLSQHKNSIKYKQAVKGYCIYATIYVLVFVSAYFIDKVWLYPMFNFMSWPQRILFFIFFHILGCFYIRIGMYLQDIARNRTVNVKTQ